MIFTGYDKRNIDTVEISNLRRTMLNYVESIGLRLVIWNFGFY